MANRTSLIHAKQMTICFERAFFVLIFCQIVLFPIAPRSGQVLLAFVGIIGLVHLVRQRQALFETKAPEIIALVGFFLFCGISYFWSDNAAITQKLFYRLILITLFTLISIKYITSLAPATRQTISRYAIIALPIGIVGGLFIGLLNYTQNLCDLIILEILPNSDFCSFDDKRLTVARTMLSTNLAFFAIAPYLWTKSKFLWLTVFIALLTACILSDSQSSIIGCLSGGMAMLLLQATKGKALRPLIIALCLSFIIIVPFFSYTPISATISAVQNTLPPKIEKQVSVNNRLFLYNKYSNIIKEKPLFGHGFGASVRYNGGHSAEIIQATGYPYSPHNFQLAILFDLGFVGTFLLIGFLFLAFLKMEKKLNEKVLPHIIAIPFAIFGFTLFNFNIWLPWLLSAFAVAILLVYMIASSTIQSDKS